MKLTYCIQQLNEIKLLDEEIQIINFISITIFTSSLSPSFKKMQNQANYLFYTSLFSKYRNRFSRVKSVAGIFE
jgi:hypothetical protein